MVLVEFRSMRDDEGQGSGEIHFELHLTNNCAVALAKDQ